MDSNFVDLISLFNRFEVRYLIIGGYAVMYHSEPRYTKDIDLVIGITEPDVDRAAKALAEFGFGLNEEAVAKLGTEGHMISLGRPPVRIDILNRLRGVTFEEAYTRRVVVPFQSTFIPFISLDDLIEVKRAAGRPQDLLDVERLELARRLKEMGD